MRTDRQTDRQTTDSQTDNNGRYKAREPMKRKDK